MKDGDQNKELKGVTECWGKERKKKKKSKIEVLANSVLGESSLPGLQTATFSLHPHVAFPLSVHREKEISCVSSSSHKGTSPIRLGPHIYDIV